MHQLKYIVISDLHLGEKDSLFTSPDGKDNQLLKIFSDCLADLLFHFNEDEKLPKMVLNGDILGLAFSTYKESLSSFEHFVAALTVQNKICEHVVYVPGNHDHHIWQEAMEDDYRQKLAARKKGEPIPEPIHNTGPGYEEGIESALFEAFMPTGVASVPTLKVLYPNFVIPSPSSKDPFVLFHHGHFAENTYHLVTKAMQAMYPELKSPDSTSALEHQNGSWIDFAFSQLGRSGEAGLYFEEFMATLSSKEKLKEHRDEMAHNLAKNVNFPYLPFHWMEKYLSKKLITNMADKVRGERYRGDTTCSDETMENLMNYFGKFCSQSLKDYGWKNQPIHFVWSHTHKPFEKSTQSEIFGQTTLTNTGGWVLPPTESPKHGASIILINQDNNVQALRIFMDYKDKEKGVLRVQTPIGIKLSEFGQSIHDKIYEKETQLRPVWHQFKTQLEQDIIQRRNAKT